MHYSKGKVCYAAFGVLLLVFLSLFIPVFDSGSPAKQSFATDESWVQNLYDEVADINEPRVKAAIFTLVRNEELDKLRSSIRQLEDRWNKHFHYPYVIFNDVEFTEEFKEGVLSVTKSKVTFAKLDSEYWDVPEWIDQARLERNLLESDGKIMYGGSLSYRKMCRYQAVKFFQHPLFDGLDYYLRIEPDVDFYCDIDYDPFLFMQRNKKVYGWIMTPLENPATVPTLWNTTKQWVANNTHALPAESMGNWLMSGSGNFNQCHFWSNFEMVDLNFYRSDAYLSYVNYLDRSGGFFYERWGDAPVHSIAAAILLKHDQLHWFENIGYRHSDIHHCPRPDFMKKKCVCDPKLAYPYRSICTHRWHVHKDIKKADFLKRLGIHTEQSALSESAPQLPATPHLPQN